MCPDLEVSSFFGYVQTAGESDLNQISSQKPFLVQTVPTPFSECPNGMWLCLDWAILLTTTLRRGPHRAWSCSVWHCIIAMQSGTCCHSWPGAWHEWSYSLPPHQKVVLSDVRDYRKATRLDLVRLKIGYWLVTWAKHLKPHGTTHLLKMYDIISAERNKMLKVKVFCERTRQQVFTELTLFYCVS